MYDNEICMRPAPHARGFTLIELLVVIAIIGVLSSVVLASLNSAKNKANDAKRATDLTAVRTALELYATDNNNTYPILGATASKCSTWGSEVRWQTLSTSLARYISKMPDDPQMDTANGKCCYVYRNNGDGSGYKFFDIDCPMLNYASAPSLIDPNRDGVPNCNVDGTTYGAWAVYTQNACSL
jgi:general secretion pathway protein G